METDVTTLLEQLIPTPDEAAALTQERRDAIDLASWVANALWQLKFAGATSEPIEMPVGLIPVAVVRKALPLFEKKGWKATLREQIGLGDGDHVEFTRA